MSITKYLNLSHLRKLLSALGQRFYAIEQRQDNLQSQIENIDLDVETDTTLSVSGMPADAGVVGATFNDLNATAWSGNISSLDNITNLDQDALYSGAGYFTLNGSAISALYIPTKATASRFFVFVPEDNVLFSEGIYCYIYSKKQPTTSIGRFNYLFVNGSQTTTLNHGLYLGSVNSYSPNNTTLNLAILFTYDQAASSLAEKPLANGDEASYGSSIKYARADHIHPHDTLKANVSAVLTKTNTTAYTPTATYHPATKGYVDGLIPANVSDLNNDSGFQTQAQVNALIAAAGDDDTTYAISISGNVITLTGSDGNTSTVTLPVYTGGVV